MRKTEPPFFDSLKSLYYEMDTLWDSTANQYGFRCNGCDENCCETEFYHHTHIEKAYFLEGFKKLPRAMVVKVSKRAKKVDTKRRIADKKGERIRIMCPVNVDGKCILYPHRPMICRLHGIPHEVEIPAVPGKERVKTQQPGCDAGKALFKETYHPFDRTPFYSRLAELEKRYCQYRFEKINRPRIKETIAQMIVK